MYASVFSQYDVPHMFLSQILAKNKSGAYRTGSVTLTGSTVYYTGVRKTKVYSSRRNFSPQDRREWVWVSVLLTYNNNNNNCYFLYSAFPIEIKALHSALLPRS